MPPRLHEGDLKGLMVALSPSLTFVPAPSRNSEDITSGLQRGTVLDGTCPLEQKKRSQTPDNKVDEGLLSSSAPLKLTLAPPTEKSRKKAPQGSR